MVIYEIYEINSAIMALADEETGEISDYEALLALELSKEEKLEGIALRCKNLLAFVDDLKDEIDALSARKMRAENEAKRMKDWLYFLLGGQKFETPKCAVTFRKTTKTELENEDSMIAWLEENGYVNCVKYADPTVKKTEVGNLLKQGIEVPGASLVTGMSVGVK